jgi:hypothetical protein
MTGHLVFFHAAYERCGQRNHPSARHGALSLSCSPASSAASSRNVWFDHLPGLQDRDRV